MGSKNHTSAKSREAMAICERSRRFTAVMHEIGHHAMQNNATVAYGVKAIQETGIDIEVGLARLCRALANQNDSLVRLCVEATQRNPPSVFVAEDYPLRAERAADSAEGLQSYLAATFPGMFTQPFSQDQKEAIRAAETVMRDGGWGVATLPRGGGSTSLLIASTAWAIQTKATSVVVCIAEPYSSARTILQCIETAWQNNAHLQGEVTRDGNALVVDTGAGHAVVIGAGQKDGFCGVNRHINGVVRRPDLVMIDNSAWRPDSALPPTFGSAVSGLFSSSGMERVMQFKTGVG